MYDVTDAIVAYVNAIADLFLAVGLIIIVYSMDDLFVDVTFWTMKLLGKGEAGRRRFSEQELLRREQRHLAVMVPAWREEAVIYSMLTTNAPHSDTTIFFVGTYPNDVATQREVERAAAAHPDNIRLVVGPHNGPTTKADCLNAILAEIERYEHARGIEFAGYILHDSEDVTHPLESPLFNALVDDIDYIQIPIYSFSRSVLQATAGTYMDEFAEFHNKDLVVRERLTGVVPCAGVAACFNRRSMAALKASRPEEVFDPTALTEDYDIAFQIKRLGLKSAFVRNVAPYSLDIPNGGDELRRVERPLAIATRENFPSEYRAAYRQRARWILGIIFQGTSTLGWGESLAETIFFLRDRKGILSGIIALTGYFLAFNALAIAGLARVSEDWRIAAYVMLAPNLKLVFFINILLFVNRLVQRTIFTTQVYGLAQGVMAAPRVVFSNVINFSAALRALYIFLWRHKMLKQPLGWDKTAHASIPHLAEDQQ